MEAVQKSGGPVGLSEVCSGCASGAPTQHMGLLGWAPPFHRNPRAGKSGLCAGNYGPLCLGREKRNFLGFPVLRGTAAPRMPQRWVLAMPEVKEVMTPWHSQVLSLFWVLGLETIELNLLFQK